MSEGDSVEGRTDVVNLRDEEGVKQILRSPSLGCGMWSTT